MYCKQALHLVSSCGNCLIKRRLLWSIGELQTQIRPVLVAIGQFLHYDRGAYEYWSTICDDPAWRFDASSLKCFGALNVHSCSCSV